MSTSIILLGPAGSGKGTQAAKLIETYGLQKIEAGDLIREGAKENSALGRYLHEIHESGQHVLDGVIRDLIDRKLKTIPKDAGLLFDGYPRTLVQAQDLDVTFSRRGITNVLAVSITVPDDVARERLLQRSICSACKAIFATRDITACPKCGAPVEVRDYDHDVAAINKRLQWYHDNVLPTIAFYKGKSMLVEVNGVHDVDAVFAEIQNALA